MSRFRLATINALGHSHTVGEKTYPRFADSDVRTRLLIRVLKRQGYAIAGMQEFQVVQQGYFKRWSTGWNIHALADNAVIWRARKFELLEKGSIDVPYFSGRDKAMPWVLVRKRSLRPSHRKVVAFLNTHNPANVHGPAEDWRREGWRRERVWVEDMLARPDVSAALVVGDKNDRDYGAWVSTHGGHVSGIPDLRGIDWIAGWGGVEFIHHDTFESSAIDRMTDHPITEAVAVI